MIVPFPIHFKDWKNYPFTLLLIGLNIFIFIFFFSAPGPSTELSFIESKSLQLTGRLYSQYLEQAGSRPELPSWISQMKVDNSEHLVALGAYALRDANFIKDFSEFQFRGDIVDIKSWKSDFKSFRDRYEQQAIYRFGLSSMGNKSLGWITYQFSHGGFLHLFSNLVFLFLVGMAVESIVGGVGLLFLYIAGGLLGGVVFLKLDSHGGIPMVGASASISALLAFYCFAEIRKRVRYYYFISPVPGQHGAIYLPTFLIIPLFLVSDFGNLWSQPQGLGGGVAYAAHIGGNLFGVVAALVYRAYQNRDDSTFEPSKRL